MPANGRFPSDDQMVGRASTKNLRTHSKFQIPNSKFLQARFRFTAAAGFARRCFATETLPGCAQPGLQLRRAVPRCVNSATLQEFSATTLMIDIFLRCCAVDYKSKGVSCEITSREAFSRS